MELLFAVEQTFSAVKSYSECLYDAFDILYKRKCAALTDPLGISGYISAAKTEAQREQLLDNVVTARNWAARALNDESTGDLINARYYWNQVFNGGFPAL
jgi:hypothetical protein